ncbi:hypothetical protein MRB53_029203 [Persea americana]|uniref:Uncharacterized protein n=1 Tax=Persea americana TaxID=3435 RepID=A0ACC2KHP8_PERAE|nr:hypothetical protein MRB53_029203 [Persea americana]
MGVYLLADFDSGEGSAGLEDKWVGEIGGFDGVSKHLGVEMEGVLEGAKKGVGFDDGSPGVVIWVGNLVEHGAGVMDGDAEIDELGEEMVVDGEGVDEDLGVYLEDVGEGCGVS